jgi:L-amino acid N-acyltransferase YncA
VSPAYGILTARPATIDDVPRITAIYNQGIEDRSATFETQPRTEVTIRGWIDSWYPLIVVERAGGIVAWASTSSYRPRDCYAGIAEFSVYVDRAARGKGAGRAAVQALIDAARNAGLEKLVSRVFVENNASRRLLGSIGFREVGVYERHAKLDDVWRDVVIVELLLQDHEDEPHGALWQPDLSTLQLWPELKPGREVLIEKCNEFGKDGPIYPGMIIESSIPEPWIEVRARWTLGRVQVGGLRFEIDDELREFFSPRHPFNAFAVYSPQGELRGWYGNVTRPARCERRDSTLLVAWPDMMLDLVMLPDGTSVDLDDDELTGSGFPQREPDISRQMLDARETLRRLLRERFFPTR